MTNKTTISLQGSIAMEVGGRKLGGAQQVALLEAIAATGSITQAARAIGMSYKAAWDTVDAMNHMAGEPLVERATGGKGGGGTRLTPRGAQLAGNFRQIEAEHSRFVQALEQQSAGLADDYLLLRRLAMKTSARNQFPGTVLSLHRGAVNDEVVLDIGHGLQVVSVLTHDSVQALGLRSGAEAMALVKSSSIVLAAGPGSARFSARNCLAGTVVQLHKGSVNTEVVLDLGHGLHVAAVITNESVRALGLSPGDAASALFKASSVILAVPA